MMKRFLCFVLLSLGCFAVSAQAQTAILHPVRACFAKPVVLTDVRAMLPTSPTIMDLVLLKDVTQSPQISALLTLALKLRPAELTGPTMPPDPWAGDGTCGIDWCACLNGWDW